MLAPTSATAAAAAHRGGSGASSRRNSAAVELHRTWTELLLSTLPVMTANKKAATNADVAAYYKGQRNHIQLLIELNAKQQAVQQKAALAAAIAADAATTKEVAAIANASQSCEPTADDNHHDDDHDCKASDGVSTTIAIAAAASADDDDDDESSFASIAARLSLLLNIILFGLKIFAVVRSGSLTVIASLLDSALDLFSGSIMVLVEYMIAHSNAADYPTGKHHFESIGTLIFSCCMFVASSKLVEDSVTSIIDINKLSLTIDFATIGVIIAVVASKLIAFILCRTSSSTMVQTLAQDHRNDVLSNTFGLGGIFLAKYVSAYIDPAVALATTAFIMFVWGRSAYMQATALSGKMADPEMLSALTMIAMNCDPRLVAVDTVRAVTSGAGYVVEIDLVLPPDMPLRDAHDIGEALQMFLEAQSLLDVSRAYVHLDYETDHDPSNHQ